MNRFRPVLPSYVSPEDLSEDLASLYGISRQSAPNTAPYGAPPQSSYNSPYGPPQQSPYTSPYGSPQQSSYNSPYGVSQSRINNQVPPYQKPNLAEDWARALRLFFGEINPIGSAQAEELPPAKIPATPGEAPSPNTNKPSKLNHRLSELAVGLNEGGGYFLAPPSSNLSGMSFGYYQGDAAKNPDAKKAMRDIVKVMDRMGLMRQADQKFVLQNFEKENMDRNTFNKIEAIMKPFINIKEAEDIIRQMDEKLGKANREAVDKANAASLQYRGRELDPIEQAVLAIWGNRSGGLDKTSQKFAKELRNAQTADVIRFVLEQPNFVPQPGDSKAKAANRLKQRIHMLNAVGEAIQQAIEGDAYKWDDISEESQAALNAVLKEVGSKRQFNFRKKK